MEIEAAAADGGPRFTGIEQVWEKKGAALLTDTEPG